VKVGIIGASGFVGGELIRLLSKHSHCEIACVVSREHAGQYVHKVHPHLRGIIDLRFTNYDLEKVISSSDFVFTSIPLKASIEAMPRLVEAGLKVVDLSPAFRLPTPMDYVEHYGAIHPDEGLLRKFIYGLPELNRDEIRASSMVANPGCMATAAILAIAPFVHVLEESGDVIIDAKIGSSGSGSKPSPYNVHAVRYGVVRPYKLGSHRHAAEVMAFLHKRNARDHEVLFSAHAVNMVRGISATVYLKTYEPLEQIEAWKLLRSAYDSEMFVRLVKDKTGGFRLPDPKLTVGSNYCDLGFELRPNGKRLILVSAMDNLVKGAAGNAIQCFNIMNGFRESEGVDMPPIYPT
jgi:N-acetyl-gamma-glutamyl-phosphate/LysW-gamma-L-alpha-aminoadipyl-6-phosphate reductase